MKTSIYARHRFHPDVIKRAVWMYFRFNLSFRDVEELMIERCVDVSYETIRRWVDNFGSTYVKRIKRRSDTPSPIWHLDEVYTKINGKMVYLWRAVDDEGTVLDVVVQRRQTLGLKTPARRWRTEEQSCRMFSRPYTKARTKGSEVQVCEERSKTALRSRSNL